MESRPTNDSMSQDLVQVLSRDFGLEPQQVAAITRLSAKQIKRQARWRPRPSQPEPCLKC